MQDRVNNVIMNMGGEDRISLARKPTYLTQNTREAEKVAGVKIKLTHNDVDMTEVFKLGQY